ncbi:exosortase-dependent surface protein XDP1 [Catenovulum agarivorans]|uniref:exosortase-dependent surface protein XDP1 n=1 Tax=Catenovulum agarivorans TaxID=1172192 RepID=UPI0002F197ED|nr:exosortase-dependent surface protein XDP1 [Catenovulum agarivorans]
MKKLILGSVLVLSSIATAQAATQTYEFDMLGGSYSSDTAYTELNFSDTQGGNRITATVTAWADTDNVQGDGWGDNTIRQAELYKWWSNGWGVVNEDEVSGDNPGHSFDNARCDDGGYIASYWSHGRKHYYCTDGDDIEYDYDFVLIEFSESVELSGLNLGWDWGSTADVTVVALGDSAPSLAGSTWSDYTGYDVFNQTINDSDGYYQLNTNTESTYWLVGAYSHIFGDCFDEADDGFKLEGIQAMADTSPSGRPTQPVSEPASLAIFGLGLVGLMMRRRRNQ